MTRFTLTPASAFVRAFALALGALVLASCGGGDGGSTQPPIGTVTPVATVTVSPGTASITVGATSQLNAATLDATGATLSGRTVAWSSSSAAVATVSSSGLVTAVAAGTATISATSEGKTGSATITVAPVAVPAYTPTSSGTLSGTQRFSSISIPSGVTITVTGNLDLSSSGAIVIAGAIKGTCTPIAITGDLTASVTGAIDNTCPDTKVAGVDVTIIGKKGVSLAGGSIKTKGNVFVTNDPTLAAGDFPSPPSSSLTGFAAAAFAKLNSITRSLFGAADAPDCELSEDVISGPASPPGPESEKLFLPGPAGAKVRMWCRGNGSVTGGPGGAAIIAQDGAMGGAGTSSNNSFAEARAGDGGTGGDVQLYATGNLTFGGSVLLFSGNGGDGGTANATGLPNTGLTKGTNASATGGKGGAPGLVDVRVGGAITIGGSLRIAVGKGGAGGVAFATAANGNNAGASAAQAGGDALATAGQGGSTVKANFIAKGLISGVPDVSGGNGGIAGLGIATAGNGGNGNAAFPAGGAGGAITLNKNAASDGSTANVGNGGNAQLRDLAGSLIGNGGNGGAMSASGGKGGQGANGCPSTNGGAGGAGGSVNGRDGAGGTGQFPGIAGGTFFVSAGIGGNGGDGAVAGAGGSRGTDLSTASGAKTGLASSFIPGTAGKPCATPSPYVLSSGIVVLSDPNGHEPFVGYTGVKSLTVTAPVGAAGTISISGSGPWVMVSGSIDATGKFTATASGTVAGFQNVPVSVSGTVASDKTISGTIQLGQNSTPTGLPNGAVTYTLKTTNP